MATKKTATTAATAAYVVISPLSHDGEDYGVGDTVELTEAQAEALIPHTVKPSQKPTSAASGE